MPDLISPPLEAVESSSWRRLVLVVALALVGTSGLEAAGTDLIDAYVQTEMQRQRIPGVAIAVVQAGRVLKKTGYGYANLEHRVPVSSETVFQSGSIGKQFTAVAVMLMVHDGKLALDDPLTKYFSDAPATWQAITIRHLLTHTSGIPNYDGKTLDLRRDYTEDELTRFAYQLPVEFPAGAKWNYSDTGYVLLGILVHRVSGRFYGDILRERVFQPLGMKSARVISESDIVPHRASGYRLVGNEIKNQEWVSPTLNTTADGSLYLSIDDYVAWDAGLRAQAILTPAEWSQVFEPVRLNDGTRCPYGFGWAVDTVGGQPRQHHAGEWQGFASGIARYVGADLTVVVLCNLTGAPAEQLVDGIAAMVDPDLAKTGTAE